jgi:6-phosphogluconolactonase (cycloisomerase 2 family)
MKSASKTADSLPSVTSPSPDPIVTTPVSTTFLYRVVSGSDKIYRASLDTATGEIFEHAPTATDVGDAPIALAVSPDHRFLFVGNNGGASVSTYSLNQTTGVPTFVSKFPTLSPTLKLLVDPLGRFLFELQNDFVVSYTIDINGGLSWQGATSIVNGGRAIAVDPTGKFLYKSSSSTGIQSYDINQTSGLLSNASALHGAASTSMKIDPNSGRMLAPMFGNSNVLNYMTSTSNNLLTFVSYLTSSGIFPYYDLEFGDNGAYVYMLNQYSSALDAYSVHPTTGALSKISSVSFPASCYPQTLTVIPTGTFAYTACTDTSGKTFGVRIRPGGLLELADSSYVTGLGGNSVVSVTF